MRHHINSLIKNDQSSLSVEDVFSVLLSVFWLSDALPSPPPLSFSPRSHLSSPFPASSVLVPLLPPLLPSPLPTGGRPELSRAAEIGANTPFLSLSVLI